jgi:predicted DNA-binding transcriptional regulator AlpA
LGDEIEMAKEIKEVMDSKELAEYLGYTQRTIYKLIKEEGLPAWVVF